MERRSFDVLRDGFRNFFYIFRIFSSSLRKRMDILIFFLRGKRKEIFEKVDFKKEEKGKRDGSRNSCALRQLAESMISLERR